MEAELDDEYETLPDANLTLIHLLEDQLHTCMPLFQAIQLSKDQLFTIASVLFDQFQKNYSNDPKFLTFFDSFLNAVIHSGSEASIVLDVIEKKKVGHHVPWLLTELHKKSGGTAAWEQSAREVYKNNMSVASSLLEFYKTDNKPEFVRIARELWQDGLFQSEFAKIYFEDLDPADDPNLYRTVTVYLNDRNFSERYYHVLLELMEKEERINYIETFKWNKPAYVHALCMEEKYTEALKFAGQHTDRWNIVDIMTPCLQFQPDLALEILERKIKELLVEERGRNFYERIARVLKIAADQSAIRPDAEKLAIKICSLYSRLTALRDELRIAGVIKK